MALSQGLHRGRWGLLAGAVAALAVGAAADEGVYRPLESEYVITGWSIEEGLRRSSVTSLAQTRDGDLWVGTFGGLARHACG